jgi:hypothetical protein
MSCGFAPGEHETLAVHAFGLELIVRRAEQPQVVDGRPAASRERLNVVVFEVRAFGAAPAAVAHERAPAPVTLGNRPPDLGGDVAPGPRAPARTGALGGRETPVLELLHEIVERPLEHARDLAIG